MLSRRSDKSFDSSMPTTLKPIKFPDLNSGEMRAKYILPSQANKSNSAFCVSITRRNDATSSSYRLPPCKSFPFVPLAMSVADNSPLFIGTVANAKARFGALCHQSAVGICDVIEPIVAFCPV